MRGGYRATNQKFLLVTVRKPTNVLGLGLVKLSGFQQKNCIQVKHLLLVFGLFSFKSSSGV